jgi:hypothetical protein
VRLILTPTAESVAAFNEVFDNFAKLPQRFAAKAFEPAFAVYAGAVEKIFELEGWPGWKPLAEHTMWERGELGYEPAHPILQREGELLCSLTVLHNLPHTIYVKQVDADPEPHTSGNILDESPFAGDDQWFSFGVVDDRFEELERYRSMVPGEFSQDTIGKNIDEKLVALIQGMDNPHASI